MVCEIFYYKCPICNCSVPVKSFLRWHFGKKDPFHLGYYQKRINYGGRKGIRRVSFEQLSNCLNANEDGKLIGGGIPNQILDRMRHAVVGTYNALHKFSLLEKNHYPAFKDKQINKKDYDELFAEHGNLKREFDKQKKEAFYNFSRLQKKYNKLKESADENNYFYEYSKLQKKHNSLTEDYNELFADYKELEKEKNNLSKKYQDQRNTILYGEE